MSISYLSRKEKIAVFRIRLLEELGGYLLFLTIDTIRALYFSKSFSFHRDWSPKFETGVNVIICIDQKIYE